jgi:hypothetical protein
LKTIILIAAPAILAACAHSGVVPMGPDTYMIANSEWGFTSGGVQTAKAMKEASAYCASIGKQLVPISTTANGVSFGKTPAAEVRFKCVQEVPSSASQMSTTQPNAGTDGEAGKQGHQQQSTDVYDQLLKLDDLRKRGLITDEEFNAEKQKVLASH